jgi:2-isopropylmalate synthase
VADRDKNLEAQGYTFDAADASFELLLLEEMGRAPRYWTTDGWRVVVETSPDNPTDAAAEATVTLTAGGTKVNAIGAGNGPVNALDHALRTAVQGLYPGIARFELTDYKVRILEASHGTDAITRVLITTEDGETGETWRNVGVGPNIIEASWEALTEALTYGLLHAGVEAK